MNETPVDLRADGVLWMLNKAVFHPRGFGLAMDQDTGDLMLVGDGSEVWTSEHLDETKTLAAFDALLERRKAEAGEARGLLLLAALSRPPAASEGSDA